MSEIREKTYEVKDMLAYESTRKANKIPGTLVHWRREGKFYHAYEWSAWLAYNYIFKFKAQRTKSKDNDYVYVGFPPDSLEKFTPEGVVVTVSDDGVFVDMLLPPDVFEPSVTPDEHFRRFQDWKQSIVPQSGSRKNGLAKELKEDGAQPMRMSDILYQIMQFNVVRKSPIECMTFISEHAFDARETS